jgi:hypothetical protein
MKRTTVVLTDEQAKRLDDERRRLGVPASAIVRQALDAYLGLDGQELDEQAAERDSSDAADKPGDLRWLIGLGCRQPITAAEAERLRADEYLRFIWEDSFGGEPSFDELLATWPRAGAPDDESPSGGSAR